MNPVMERFFGQHGVTSTHRQTLKYLPLPREADLFVQYLHVEMWFSFLNGHDHAAIVTGCALLEYAIKDAVFFEQYLKADKVFDRSSWDKIDSMTLDPLVRCARKHGIISEEAEQRFLTFKDNVRNKWLHGGTPPNVKASSIPEVIEANYRTGEVKKVRVDLGTNLAFQRIGRILADRETAPGVVAFVDESVCALLYQNEQKNVAWQQVHGDTPPSKAQMDRALDNIRKQFGESAIDGLSIVMGHIPPQSTED